MTGTAVFDLADELEATAPRHVRVARDTNAIYIWNIYWYDLDEVPDAQTPVSSALEVAKSLGVTSVLSAG